MVRAGRLHRQRSGVRDHRRPRAETRARQRRRDDEPAGCHAPPRGAALREDPAATPGRRPRRLRGLAPHPGCARARAGGLPTRVSTASQRSGAASSTGDSSSPPCRSAGLRRRRRREREEDDGRTPSTWPAGKWLVLLAGIVLIGIGLYQGYRGLTQKLPRGLEDGGDGAGGAATGSRGSAPSVISHGSVVFGLIGVFLIKAALDYDARARRSASTAPSRSFSTRPTATCSWASLPSASSLSRSTR